MKRAIIPLLFSSFILFLLYLPLGMSTGVWLVCNRDHIGRIKRMGNTIYYCCWVIKEGILNYQWQTSPCPQITTSTTTTKPPTTTTSTSPTPTTSTTSTSTTTTTKPTTTSTSITTTTTPSTITLTANPSSIPADGTSQSTITAQLNPARTGVKVSFSTTLGRLSSSYCYTGSTGSCSVYITSTQVGTAKITATAQGYSPGYTSVTFATPPASVVVSVGQRYISPGQNLTVTVYIKSYDYKFGKDVSLDIKLDGKDWSIFDDKKLVADIGWSYSCDGKHEGMYGKWKCDSSGCHSHYNGWPMTVDSKSSEHWIRITFTYQLPANIPTGMHTITVTPTLHSTPIRLTSASVTIYVVPRSIFDPVIILIRDLLKALLG